MTRTLLTIFVLALSSLAFAAEPPAADQKQNDDDFAYALSYELVVPQQQTATGDNIEVLEIFWYGCPHCNDFEPIIQPWVKAIPDGVEFRRLPAVFRKSWEQHARAYFAAEILGITEKIHAPMFNAIHKKKKPMNTEKELAELFSHFGVDKERFLGVYNSFSIDNKVRNASEMVRRYGIRGVPTMIVNGKYRVTTGLAGGQANMLKVVDYLIEKEKREAAAMTTGAEPGEPEQVEFQ